MARRSSTSQEPACRIARRLPRAAGAGRAWHAGLLALALLSRPGQAEDGPPAMARAGLEIATVAARAWAPDAVLIYLENDEALDPGGAATRWGYLFHSAALDKARVYSVSAGKIVLAEHLDMKFEAPAVLSEWIDSGAALEAAEREGGREFRAEQGGRLATMLLMRGAFHDGDPDRTTWTLVYTSAQAPSLFVVVDAAQGKVRRTWRG